MLRRVPSRSFEELMHRRRAIKGPHLLPAGFVLEPAPPVLDPLDNAIAVSRYFRPGHAGFITGRHVGVVRPIFDIVYGSLQKGFADAKCVMAQKPDRPIAVVDRSLHQARVGNLANVTLRGAQHGDPLIEQCLRGKRAEPAPLQADEFRDIFHVLAEDELAAFGQYRHALRAESEQLLSCRGVVQNIEGGKVYALFRKKLFRPEAAASTGLGEQDEFVIGNFHCHVLSLTAELSGPYQRAYDVSTQRQRMNKRLFSHEARAGHEGFGN